MAVADGTVEEVGWKGGNGNTMLIRHRANFKTMYNHLSGFAKGIRAGTAVRQKQVIGYVGSTGLSTGPHLDYRVMKNGKFVNPLKESFLPGQPVSSASKKSFEAERDALLQQLRGQPAPPAASARRTSPDPQFVVSRPNMFLLLRMRGRRPILRAEGHFWTGASTSRGRISRG